MRGRRAGDEGTACDIRSRVPTKNPRPWEYDDSLPEPDEATWAKISLTIERTDGGVVDAELIRPRAWVDSYDLQPGTTLSMHIEELKVDGTAFITAIDPCPVIASGEGCVVTARFMTRQVDEVATVTILGPDGETETLTGTTIHPIWSVDRQDWVELAELQEGETLQAANGLATVLLVKVLNRSTPVYNFEVHGEHVYQVGELGLLVHNSDITREMWAKWSNGGMPTVEANVIKHFVKHGDDVGAKTLSEYMNKAIAAMEARTGRGRLIEGATEGVRRFDVHGVNRYVDVDTILEKVVSYGPRLR